MQQYIPRYDTLRLLDEASLFLIGDRLKRFMEEYGPLKWPIDCFWLTDTIMFWRKIDLTVISTNLLSRGVEAVTVYDPEKNRYLMIMRRVPENWKERSSFRRCNFTVAHELGHIFLGHLAIPEENKSPEQIRREDAEADEFASRLLMPEELMLTARFASREHMAASLLVSEQACFHRLNNLRRLDRLALPAPVCPACGNRRISPTASWCRMCGAFLGDRIPEQTARMMPPRMPRRCPVCDSDAPMTPEDDCSDCGAPRRNPCLAEYDQPRHPNPPDARFCETCGAVTSFSDIGLFRAAPSGGKP